MSVWYFLSNWFGGASTLGVLFKRSMVNVAWAIAVIFTMMFFQVPAGYAAIVFYGVFIVNGMMFFFYHRQRTRMRS